jgi:Helix-turn-helix domain of resolvase
MPMPTILLLISLLLHVVAFYFIVVLYMKYSTIKNISDTQRQILEETENSMTSFLIDIKDENDRLIEKLVKTSNTIPQKKEERDINPINQDKKASHIEIQKPDKHVDKNELPDYLLNVDQVEDIVEINQSKQLTNPSFEDRAINLYKEGHTIEQIAKQLNVGKTEIELLLKFRQL